MKIQGPNTTNINAYKRQLHQHVEQKEANEAKDKIDISSAAKKLQETNKMSKNRTDHVNQIKQAVQSGQYEVNIERTSEKLIDFWSSHS